MDECMMKKAVAAEAKELPVEIITEVLLRLPVKSLVRFRCVSKAWFSLITHPQFCQLHLNHHRNRLQSSVVFYSRPYKAAPEFQCIGGGYREDNFSKVVELDCPSPFNTKCESLIFVGCCDGIICFLMNKGNDDRIIILWNPSIRQCRTLRFPSRLRCPPFGADPRGLVERIGFGYDSLTNDYKVVRLPFNYGFLPDDEFEFTYVFTLKTNSWRRIQGSRFKYSAINQDIFHVNGGLYYSAINQDTFHVNGGLYWRVFNQKEEVELLLRFDLAEETISEVALPPIEVAIGFINRPRFGLWGSSLCMMRHCDLWVLGENEGWTKRTTMPEIYGDYQKPICFTNTGKVFILVLTGDAGKYVLYDTKERTYEKLNIHERLRELWFGHFVYTDSLISPGTDNAVELQR